MKIFVVTDLHGQRTALKSIDQHLAKHRYDGVFMLGDLCNWHDANALYYASDFIDLITSKYQLPLFVIHGNQEPPSVKLLYQQRSVNVHFNERKLGDYSIVGVGFGDTFPTDPTFAQDKILLTHEPPRAKVIAQMKQKTKLTNMPLIHLSGHLHSIAKAHQIGPAILVQVPTAMDNRAVSLELPSRRVSFIVIP